MRKVWEITEFRWSLDVMYMFTDILFVETEWHLHRCWAFGFCIWNIKLFRCKPFQHLYIQRSWDDWDLQLGPIPNPVLRMPRGGPSPEVASIQTLPLKSLPLVVPPPQVLKAPTSGYTLWFSPPMGPARNALFRFNLDLLFRFDWLTTSVVSWFQ